MFPSTPCTNYRTKDDSEFSDVTNHTILDTAHLSCTTSGKNQFELVTASLNHVLSTWKDSTPQPLLEFPIFPPDGL